MNYYNYKYIIVLIQCGINNNNYGIIVVLREILILIYGTILILLKIWQTI